jgi:hypothetical protein
MTQPPSNNERRRRFLKFREARLIPPSKSEVTGKTKANKALRFPSFNSGSSIPQFLQSLNPSLTGRFRKIVPLSKKMGGLNGSLQHLLKVFL